MCAPELELTLGDMIAALSLVSRRQAEEEKYIQEEDGCAQQRQTYAPSYAPLGVRTSWREWAASFWAGRPGQAGQAGWAPLHESSAQSGGGGGGAEGQGALRVAASEQRQAESAMWFALSAYGWPLYIYRRSGRCLLAAPRALCSLCAAALRGSGGRGPLGRSAGGGGGATRGVAVRHATAVIEGNQCCTKLDEAALLVSLADMHLGRGVDGDGGGGGGGGGGGELGWQSLGGGEEAGGEGAPHTVWRGVFHNDIHRTPYFVAAHATARQLVVCVRGSLSLADAATDMMAEAALLPRGIEGDAGAGGGALQYAHRGILHAAEGLLLDLERCGALAALP